MPKELLTSPQNSRIQLVRSLLTQPRNTRKHTAFVAEGVRLVEEGIIEKFPLRFILYTKALSKRGLSFFDHLSSQDIAFEIEESLMNTLSDTETNQGILAVFDLKPLPLPVQPDFLVVLDNLRDPGNLGTILRTADAAGVQAAILTPGTADAFAPKVVRSGMGAHFRLPIYTFTWQQIANSYPNVHFYAAEMNAPRTYWQANFTAPCALIIGSEAKGISSSAKELNPISIQIPMPGRAESLNAAVAAGILLFEVQHQRLERN